MEVFMRICFKIFMQMGIPNKLEKMLSRKIWKVDSCLLIITLVVFSYSVVFAIKLL
jgi:hypothetical protein